MTERLEFEPPFSSLLYAMADIGSFDLEPTGCDKNNPEEPTVRLETRRPSGSLRLDHHGMSLIPQPSDDATDPLNWSYCKKLCILIMMAISAFFGNFSVAILNPSYAQVAATLNVTVVEATYIGAVAILGAGVSGFLWSPLADVYGRRPILLISQTIAVASGFGSAYVNTFNGIIALRLLAGIGHGSAFVLSTVVISDIYFLHERGKMIGIVAGSLMTGPAFGSLPAGYLTAYTSWRYTLILSSASATFCLFMLLVALPETLYYRDELTQQRPERANVSAEKTFQKSSSGGEVLDWKDFVQPFHLLRHKPIVVVGFFQGFCFMLGSVIPAQTFAPNFYKYFHWDAARIGLALSVSTTLGGVIGSVSAGPLADRLMFEARKRAGGKAKPEARLLALAPGVLTMFAGSVIYGYMVQFHDLQTSWSGACLAVGLSMFSTQITVTPSIAYVVDCYKPDAAQVLQLLSFARQTLGFTVGFWSLRFSEHVGFHYAGLTLGLVLILVFAPVMAIMRFGEQIRSKQ